MPGQLRHLIIAVSLALATMPASSAAVSAQSNEQAQDKKEQKEKEQKEKEPKEKKGLGGKITGVFGGGKSEEEKATEQEQKYQTLRAKANEKYKTSAEFKQRVNEDYKEKRRQHSEYAFQINTSDTKDELITFTGDKLKNEDTLYDNPLVQSYVNRVGQALVPENSPHRYAFKVILDPVPDARSLSTGTVYITTGLLSLVDTEAQLAYILAHEVAHIHKHHWFEDALVANELEDRRRSRDKTNVLVGLGVGVLTGGIIGGKSGSASSGVFAGAIFGYGAYSVMKFFSELKVYNWDAVQENEADEYALNLILNRNYDPREVPKFFARMKKLAEREPHVTDGFLARVERINERTGHAIPLIGGMTTNKDMARGGSNLRRYREGEADDGAPISPLDAGKPFGPDADATKREKATNQRLKNYDALLSEKLANNGIIAAGPEFDMVMADLKRDNGVRAFYYDMFQMALDNLREAQEIRTDDPYAAFYYGKVLQLTARNRAEQAQAMEAFKTAINLDQRGVLPEPHLQRALALMADRNPSQRGEIIDYLKKYVDIYQQEHSGELPPNMDAIYAYLKSLGEHQWAARRVTNVSTKNLDPLGVIPGAGQSGRAQQPEAPAPNPPAPPREPEKRKPVKP
ncbi:MAG: M48 family metalloprotease [Blastocatellia bacterium]